MSISKQIIFKSDAEVARALKNTGELNVIDEYGYTPLVQTAIVNSVSKAQLLLKAGAKTDFTDLTGRTALHWAASNGNRDLCELLLKNGADPNAYTYPGQPVLVIPFLKHQKDITELLFRYGANLNFAQDFINAKLLGHRFELEGRVDIIDHTGTFIEVEFEGFYPEFTLELVANSLVDFRNNFGGKHLRKYFSKVDAIIAALDNASALMKYQNYLTDVDKYKNEINTLLDREHLILPISFEGHAITLVKFWEWIIRCDRGEFGRKNGTIILYHIRRPSAINKSFLKQILYKRQYAESINEGLADYLDLEVAWKLPISEQRAGNCTWANTEAVIPAMMFLLLLEEHAGKDAESCEKEALKFYNDWVDWDKNRNLHFCVDSFAEANDARKATKNALLAAIIFQTCDYNNPKDREKVAKMIPFLTLPNYTYILESYIKVFSSDKKNPYLKNLRNFLDDYGVELET